MRNSRGNTVADWLVINGVSQSDVRVRLKRPSLSCPNVHVQSCIWIFFLAEGVEGSRGS